MTGAPHSSVNRYRELARNPPKHGLERELLLDGPHLLHEARKSGLTVESAAFEPDVFNDPSVRELAEQLAADGADVLIVSRKTLASMSPVKTPTGAVGIARRSLASLDEVLRPANALVVVAHDVQDPGNVGGIVRTAEAAGATAFIATPSSADPFGWKALRGSMGSALRLPIARAEIDGHARSLSKADIATVGARPARRRAAVRGRPQEAIGTDPRRRRARAARGYPANSSIDACRFRWQPGRVAQRGRSGGTRAVRGVQTTDDTRA